jgi:hypothetical protein
MLAMDLLGPPLPVPLLQCRKVNEAEYLGDLDSSYNPVLTSNQNYLPIHRANYGIPA